MPSVWASSLLSRSASTREARAEEARAAPSQEPAEERPKTSTEGQPAEGLRANEVLLFRTAALDKSDGKARASDAAALARAQQLDLVLTDAIQDLGLTLNLSEGTTSAGARTHRSRGSRAGRQTERLGRLSQHRGGGIGASGADGGGAPGFQGRVGTHRDRQSQRTRGPRGRDVARRDRDAFGHQRDRARAAPRRPPRAAEQPRSSGSFTRSVDPSPSTARSSADSSAIRCSVARGATTLAFYFLSWPWGPG